MPKSNRVVEAFKESYNAIGIAGAAALSLAMLNPAPLIAAIVMEAAYLLFVPDSEWYAARLARRFDAEVEARRLRLKEQTLPLLREEMRQRFARLEDMRRQIDAQCRDDKTWFREVLRKLDYLLEKFLLFASKEVEFRAYLEKLHEEIRREAQPIRRSPSSEHRAERDLRGRRDREDRERRDTARIGGMDFSDLPQFNSQSTPQSTSAGAPLATSWIQQTVEEIQAHYEQMGEQLQASLQAEADPATQSILQKRVDILLRRNEFVGKIGRILTNINHQLQLVEDTFGLINDEIRARSPEQILADVEEVVVATDTMSSSLEELASVDQMFARIG